MDRVHDERSLCEVFLLLHCLEVSEELKHRRLDFNNLGCGDLALNLRSRNSLMKVALMLVAFPYWWSNSESFSQGSTVLQIY